MGPLMIIDVAVCTAGLNFFCLFAGKYKNQGKMWYNAKLSVSAEAMKAEGKVYDGTAAGKG